MSSQCLWSTMECSQPTAWTLNQNLHVVFNAEVFTKRPTNSSSTLPRATHLEGVVIGCHQSLYFTLNKCSDISWLCPACLPTTTSIYVPTLPTIAITNYTHAPIVINQSASNVQLWRFWESSSGVCGNSTSSSSQYQSLR